MLTKMSPEQLKNERKQWDLINQIASLATKILHGTQKKGKHRSNNGANRARQRLFEQTAQKKRLEHQLAELKAWALLGVYK